ncbi:SKP1-like protein 1 [Miscanthus floridulus]|uniref:SKP1-like protein 1 n=1 Tax=Miscanthus floridulus TaxID=154761 RepID=UPI003459FDDE
MAAAADSSGDGGTSSGEKTIVLVSSDNSARFEVREAAALLSQTVRRMIDEAGADASGDGITLPDVDAKTLAKVLEYCNKHAPASSSSSAAEAAPPAEGEEDLERFDREFVRVDMGTLYSLVTAASYLKIEGLLNLTCQTIADMIKGKTPEQIRKTLGITSEFTPEEEDEVRRENAWAF